MFNHLTIQNVKQVIIIGLLNWKPEFSFPIKTVILQETASTNTVCKELFASGIHSALVIALSQTGGKGRLGRNFYSPAETGIYMSLLLRPSLNAQDTVALTTAAAVAVSKAIDEITGKTSLIKWVNDIYLYDKKVCGILCEAGLSPNKDTPDYVIVGIGININTPKNNFPDDIKDKAGSLFEESKTSDDVKKQLILKIVENFFEIYNALPLKNYMNYYRNKSLLQDKEVSFVKDGLEFSGKVIGITDNAGIIIKTKNETVTLCAGEVSLKF